MRGMMRIPRPGTVLGMVAVVLALGGSAMAAGHYLITSKHQIAPKVLKSLRGAAGAAGRRGPIGPNGAAGASGATGAAGPANEQTSFFDGPNTIPANTENFQAIFNNLPSLGAAKYVAIAKLSITPTGPGEVQCALFQFNGAGGTDTSYVQGSGIESTMTLTEPADFTGTTATSFGFAILCTTPSGTSAEYKQAKITAIQTANINVASG